MAIKLIPIIIDRDFSCETEDIHSKGGIFPTSLVGSVNAPQGNLKKRELVLAEVLVGEGKDSG